MSNLSFEPNWASPPGDTIKNILEREKISLQDFAVKMDSTVESIKPLLQGDAIISIELAIKLESTLGASTSFWLARDEKYRKNLSRLSSFESADLQESWVKKLPLKAMVKFGWIPESKDLNESIDNCLTFFGVRNVHAFNHACIEPLRMTAFRTSETFKSSEFAVAAWLRKGEIEADLLSCSPWNPENFKKSLPKMVELSRESDSSIFIPRLQKICAESGVALVIARAPTDCKASGATRFVADNKALIMLSFRHLSDDHFWFTFFHEAGHLLMHSEEELFLEGFGLHNDKMEEEANQFSALTMIPPEFQNELAILNLEVRTIMRFAKKVGVSPGVVVGQLQHLGRVNPKYFNKLKVRFKWLE